MAKSKDVHAPQQVAEYIQKLDPAFAGLVEAVRQLILKADSEIGEQIKWNAPSFFYTGAMKPFDPKEYKRDIVVMNLRKGAVLLVFPTGAAIKNDTTGLLEGSYADGRRMITFKNKEEIKAKGKKLQEVIRLWLQTVEKA
jgi:hypothetical protein